MGSSGTILLVENNPNQSLLYRLELEDEGYEVVQAFDGWDAIQKTQNDPLDLIVVDPHAPRMEGIESFCRMLAANAGLPVIVYTASAGPSEAFADWAPEANLVKSSDLEELKREILRILLARRGPPREDPQHRAVA